MQPVLTASPWETGSASKPSDPPRPTLEGERGKYLETAWKQHFHELYRRSLGWTNGRHEDAEDALSQAAIVALQKLPGHLPPEEALPWLVRLVYSKCMDIHRDRKRRLGGIEDLDVASLPEPSGEGDLESALLDSELASFVRACLAEMPERLRSVAEPYLFRDLRYAEIATLLEITEVNVRKRMQEARAVLRQCIRAYLEGRVPRRAARETAAPRPQAPPRKRSQSSLPALLAYVRRHPKGWKRRQELADRLAREGRFEEAAEQLRLALDRQPGAGLLWRALGRVLAALGRPGEAVTAYEEALRRTRDAAAQAEIRRDLDLCRETLRAAAARPPEASGGGGPRQPSGGRPAGDPPERVRTLRTARVTLSGGVETEGLLALRLPLGEEPRPRLELEAERDPDSGTKPLTLARALLEEGRAQEALLHLERGVARQPGHLGAWLDLIAIYRLEGRPAAATGACERALAANYRPAAALFQGLRAQCLGRPEEAERAYLEAWEAMPESPAPWIALADLYGSSGRPQETAEALDEALVRSPTDVAALALGAEALRLLGRSAEARRRDTRALEADGANPPALERLLDASARRAAGRFAPEGPLWRAVEGLAQTRSAARSLLSFLRLCGGDLGGIGEMVSLVAERPRLPQARFEHARLQDALGRPLAALQEIDAARALAARSRELDRLACRVALRAGLPRRALEECENLLARYGEAWDTASTAAWALAHLGHLGGAADVSQAAVAQQRGLPAAWFEHGRVLARAERLEEAVAATENGWSLLPEGDGCDLAAPAALDLAVLHRRLGEPERARHWALLARERCAALGELDPVRASVLGIAIQAEFGRAAEPPAALPVDFAPVFLRIEERRFLTTQASETFFG